MFFLGGAYIPLPQIADMPPTPDQAFDTKSSCT